MDLGECINRTMLQQHELDEFPLLFAVERDYMAAEGYSTCSLRSSLRVLVLAALFRFWNTEDFDRFVVCLAMSYFDRYLSRYRIPRMYPGGLLENLHLLATSCLSLAWKMRTLKFCLPNFLAKQGLNYTVEQIQRTEMIILKRLKWRMRSLTSFCFFNYFLSLSNLKSGDRKTLKQHAVHLLVRRLYVIKFTEFKPSIIAASALLAVAAEKLPETSSPLKRTILGCPHVNMDQLSSCLNEIMKVMQNPRLFEEAPRPDHTQAGALAHGGSNLRLLAPGPMSL
ncbi:putative cyclin-D6-1 [Malania oleifera]|uniref:putative cyclin-D6-1 n=1 Tax=Malania oleifera TaxID=397392 RepID=UPI0025AE2425|nr:putative cyclin-D6-1 [Malania oleifera]